MRPVGFFLCTLLLSPALVAADLTADSAIHPQVKKIVEEVSAGRIRATIERLVAFGTRNTMSAQDDPEHGIGAARKWIFQHSRATARGSRCATTSGG